MNTRLSSGTAVGVTRDEFLKAANRQFAERGFYGTSIASIAEELGLTKQALIHHFGTKERLYGEVLARLADRLSRDVASARSAHTDPARQLEDLLVRLYGKALENPEDAQLLMRELLDNRARAEQAHSWYLKDFLSAMISMVRRTANARTLSDAEALTRVYPLLGAINYFVISAPTLRQMYGQREFGILKDRFPQELRRIVRMSLGR